MTESMFASLRIVALMLAADKVIHPLERSWFLAVVNTCGPTAVQRKTLIADLERKNKVSLEEMYFQVTDNKDRELLNRYLRRAMGLDKKHSREELDLFARVKSLSEEFDKSQGVDYAEYGRLLLAHDRKNSFWREMEAAGHLLNTRRGSYWVYPYSEFTFALFLSWLIEVVIDNKIVLLVVLGLAVISLLVIF